MSTDSPSSPSSPKSSAAQQVVGVPAAIVLAGGLIALAIYFGGGLSSGSPTGQPDAAGTLANNGAPAQPAAPAEPPIGDFRAVDASDHVRGPANAKLTIIEYSDLECPFCKRFHPTLQQVMSEYDGDVRWVYRHFPLEAIHPNARIAAVATECAAAEGKFWELTDYIFENTSSGAEIAKSALPALAEAAGVTNIPAFTACLDSEEANAAVDADLADAQAAGGRGTPYSIIINEAGEKQAINGAQPYASVKATIDQLL